MQRNSSRSWTKVGLFLQRRWGKVLLARMGRTFLSLHASFLGSHVSLIRPSQLPIDKPPTDVQRPFPQLTSVGRIQTHAQFASLHSCRSGELIFRLFRACQYIHRATGAFLSQFHNKLWLQALPTQKRKNEGTVLPLSPSHKKKEAQSDHSKREGKRRFTFAG